MTDVVRPAWKSYFAGNVARNTLHGSFWQVVRLLLQLAMVTIVARTLGPHDYGTVAGYTGLAIFLAGATSLGTGTLLIREVSRDRSLWNHHWRAMNMLSLVVTLVLAALYLLLATPLLDTRFPFAALLSITAAELLFYPMVYMASFGFQAFERIGWATAVATLTSACRLTGAVIYAVYFRHDGVVAYCAIYMLSSALGALGSFAALTIILKPGAPKIRSWFKWTEIRSCLSYCTSTFTANGMIELDKVLAVRFAGPADAAIYSIAYRAMSALATPVSTLALAIQPTLFRLGVEGPGRTQRVMRLTLLSAAAAGVISAIAMVIGGQLLPLVLGPAYGQVSTAAMYLTLLPLVYCLRVVMGTMLTTAGGQLTRAGLEASALCFMTLLAAVSMPRHGVGGIAFTITCTEFMLLSGLSIATWKRNRPTATPTTSLNPP